VWCAEIERLSLAIGLHGVNAQPVKRTRLPDPATGKKGNPVWHVEPGYLNRGEISMWPWSLTSEEYYKELTTPRR
jgi:hypothetical protein